MFVIAAIVTAAFYFILDYFNTANIIPSTISVTTSFLAVYLTFRRSAYFSLAYAANDIVLIILWGLASLYDMAYIAVVVCFVAFFANDIYGFLSWKRMKVKQRGQEKGRDYFDVTYGGLGKIDFKRTKPLGYGDECCDFHFLRK